MCCKALRYRAVSSATTLFLIFWTNLSQKKGGKNTPLIRGAECTNRFMVRRCSKLIRTCHPHLWHPTKEIAICRNSMKTILNLTWTILVTSDLSRIRFLIKTKIPFKISQYWEKLSTASSYCKQSSPKRHSHTRHKFRIEEQSFWIMQINRGLKALSEILRNHSLRHKT